MKNMTFKKITSQRLFLPIFCLALVLLINIVTTPNFFAIEVRNGVLYGYLIDIINRASELVILAVGMTLVVSSSAGTDISVGAIMAVSLETGRRPGQPSENPPRATVLAGEMVEYFKEQNRMTCCRGLIPGLKKGDPERKKRCSVFVEQMSGKAAEIILTEREKALK